MNLKVDPIVSSPYSSQATPTVIELVSVFFSGSLGRTQIRHGADIKIVQGGAAANPGATLDIASMSLVHGTMSQQQQHSRGSSARGEV